MRITCFLCAILAPAFARAAAFPWSLPEPTLFVPEIDRWSPAPTAAPQLPSRELFRRQAIISDGDNTCGYLSGLRESSITCYDSNAVCATNTYFGVHGCCDPSSLSRCTIPTACIASTAMSTDCPDDSSCASNKAIAKCTGWGMGECTTMFFVYSKTLMSQFGCAASAGTTTVQRYVSSSSAEAQKTITVTTTATPTPTTTDSGADKKKTASLGPIIGGTVGGCVVLSAIAFGIFTWYRRRKTSPTHRPPTHFHSSSVTEYDSMGFQRSTETYVEEDHKLWLQHQQYQRSNGGNGNGNRPLEPMPQYPGMNQYGILEVDGRERPVEAPSSPAPSPYHVS